MNDETPSRRHPTLNHTREVGSLRDDALHEPQAPTRKVQLLYVGPLVFGIFEDEIATIAEWRRPSPLPHSPTAVLGVVSIQGRMLTVLDPLNLFGETRRLVFPPGLLVALRGDEQIALAIEYKGETLDLAVKDILPQSEPAIRAVDGSFHYGDHLVRVIQVRGLFPAALRGSERRRRRF
ncbi:MAG: chemotaxis protein CheW [Acidobacteriota bacterium]|nr:chemotaxis protein CheW [Acidobacteriota bacterium]